MSDSANGPGWWQASNARWYPPEQHPDYRLPPSTSTTEMPTGKEAAQALTDIGSGCTKMFLLAVALVVLVVFLVAVVSVAVGAA